MNLQFKDFTLDLSYTMIMGVIALEPSAPLSKEEIHDKAQSFLEAGASFIEFGVKKNDAVSLETESELLLEALDAVKDIKLYSAVYTSNPNIMEQVVNAGAQMIIDPCSLRVEGAMETIAKLKVPICLCFDSDFEFSEESDPDPCSKVSEFFYERLDSCLNAHINRSRILIDPMIGINNSFDYRLKMLGRLKTFKSFALPITCETPRILPVADEYMASHSNIAIAVNLFVENQGVNIIRASNVSEVALALDTWQALNLSARPFKLSRAITNRIKAFKRKKELAKQEHSK